MDGNSQKGKVIVLVLASLVVLVAIDRAVGNTSNSARMTVIRAAVAAETEVVEERRDEGAEESANVQTFETVQGSLLKICEARGYGEDCAKTLLGMLWKESLNDAHAIGDHGQARGYFQIWYRLHHISIDCAEDLACSANWTLDYMESNGYPRYVTYAIQCHNGCNIPNGYWQSVQRWGNRKWNTPMFIEQPQSEVALK